MKNTRAVCERFSSEQFSNPRQGSGCSRRVTPAPAATTTLILTENTKLANERESFSQNKNKAPLLFFVVAANSVWGLCSDHPEGRGWPNRDCFVLHFIQTWNFNSNQDV